MVGKILGGRYELLEKIGSGGMATVYKAKCHLLKRYVAVKILRPEFVEDEEFLYRFKRESQAAASLSHQNIVNIYDVGQEDNIHYIVMEYVKGQTLKELIKERKRLSVEESVNIAVQICSALEHAHKHNVIHRDIKPQNIMVGEDGIIKVTDFGIARAVTSSTVTMDGNDVVGSVHYFSPEQARGGFTDARSDIYSLGIVLYEMLTGTVPFNGDSPISIAIKHIQESIKPPIELNSDIPKSLQDVILKSTEKEQCYRYQSADEMKSDLQRVLKEPNGSFVKRILNSDAPTQKISAVDLKAQKDSRRYRKENTPNRLRNSNKLRIIIIIAAVLLVFGMLYLIGRNIYIADEKSKEFLTPKIESKSENDAKQTLSKAGLTMNVKSRQSNAKIADGYVISQNPNENEKVKKGDTVSVVISTGPKKITVPDLSQKDYATAANEIEGLGLKVGNVSTQVSDKPQNYVIDQDPKANQQVAEGSKINITISKPPEVKPKSVPNLKGLTLDSAEKIIEKNGFSVGNINYENSDEQQGIVTKQDPQAKTTLQEKKSINLWVSNGNKETHIKSVTVNLGQINDNTSVQITLLDETGNEEVIYEKTHNKGENTVTLVIENSGVKTLIVYINGVKNQQRQINFDALEGN